MTAAPSPPGRNEDGALRIGVFDHLDRNDTPLAQYYEDRLAIAEAYDRAGFFCYHLAEHHGTPIGLAPSPSLFLSAVAQRTRRLRLAPLVYLLPFYHPLRLIEEISMLDQLSGGRLEVGIGRGISTAEMSYYGLDPQEAAARYAETLDILRAGLGRRSLSYEGRFYRFDDVPIELAPLQETLRFWYGVHAPESAERAARSGLRVVTNEGTAGAKAVAERYRAAWEDAGHDDAPIVGAVRFIVVAEDDAAALAAARRAYPRWHENFYHVARRHGYAVHHPKPPTFDAAIVEGVAFAGSPATVASALRRHVRETGITYVLGQFAFGALRRDETQRSVELFAREVVPALEPKAGESLAGRGGIA